MGKFPLHGDPVLTLTACSCCATCSAGDSTVALRIRGVAGMGAWGPNRAQEPAELCVH